MYQAYLDNFSTIEFFYNLKMLSRYLLRLPKQNNIYSRTISSNTIGHLTRNSGPSKLPAQTFLLPAKVESSPTKTQLSKINYQQFTISRSIHLSEKRQIGPVAWIIIRPLMKIGAVLSGRAFRKWWKELPADKKGYLKESVRKSRWKILAAIGGITLLTAVNYILHLQEAPITGRRRFIAFTESQYSKIADFEASLQTELHKAHFLPPEHPATKNVLRVGQRLYAANLDIQQLNKMKFTVAVVHDDNNANAFVMPTGHVFVFTGLLKLMENEDQLAVVLGHEMAHAILAHGVELCSRTALFDAALIVVMAAIWAFLPNDGIALVAQWFYNRVVQIMLSMPYSRELEREADEVGLMIASKACFDVREAPVFWTFMSVNDKVNETETLEWLSTHPSHNKRADNLNEMMPKALETRLECDCPRLPSKDPRDLIPQFHQLLADYENNKKAENEEKPKNTVPIILPTPSSSAGALMDNTLKSKRLARKGLVEENRDVLVTKKVGEERNTVPQLNGEDTEIQSAEMDSER